MVGGIEFITQYGDGTNAPNYSSNNTHLHHVTLRPFPEKIVPTRNLYLPDPGKPITVHLFNFVNDTRLVMLTI